jgi:hypothetical protein
MERFDDSVAQYFEKCVGIFFRELENITGKQTIVSALFDNDEIVDLTELVPYLNELRGQKLAKKGADTDVRKIIAFASNDAAA